MYITPNGFANLLVVSHIHIDLYQTSLITLCIKVGEVFGFLIQLQRYPLVRFIAQLIIFSTLLSGLLAIIFPSFESFCHHQIFFAR